MMIWLSFGILIVALLVLWQLIQIRDQAKDGFEKTHAYLVRIALKDIPGEARLETFRHPDGTYGTRLSYGPDPAANVIVDPRAPKGK